MSTVAVVAEADAAEAHAPSPAPKAEEAKGANGGEGAEKSAPSKEGGGEEGHGGKGDKTEKSGKGDKGDKGDKGYAGRKRGSYEDDDKEYVECDPNALVAALVRLNENRGGNLVLAKDCTYTLTANLDGSGLPRITQPISIFGHGATIERAANADQFRLFDVGPGGDLKLRKLTLTRGKTIEAEEGGAIRVSNAGRIELNDVKVTDNTVDSIEDDDAGGLLNDGIATVRSSVFQGNSGDDGAAITNNDGKVEIVDSEITRNTADPDDGFAALYNDGTMKILKSTVSHNIASDGGGVHNDEVLEVEESTFAYNFAAEEGGGIESDAGQLHLRDSLIKGNTAGENGGGVDLPAPATIVRTKIVDNVVTGGEATGGGVFVDVGVGEAVSIRDSKIIGNQAPGDAASGGGIFVTGSGGVLRLTDVKVTGNISDEPAGGVDNNGTVETYGKIKIVDNVPTNCEGGANPVPNCFG
ncbi:hypothetical protein ABZ532_17745 [Streptomyces sp. NPDC019396]|uniref:hypothetical protein n=1 Tax=Streptomyces sp. NPDC019396 TaxID=3154687 RepID=UPI0033D1F322